MVMYFSTPEFRAGILLSRAFLMAKKNEKELFFTAPHEHETISHFVLCIHPSFCSFTFNRCSRDLIDRAYLVNTTQRVDLKPLYPKGLMCQHKRYFCGVSHA